MIHEIDIGGVFLPAFAAPAAISALVWLALTSILERTGAYASIWRPALFNACAYVFILAIVATVAA